MTNEEKARVSSSMDCKPSTSYPLIRVAANCVQRAENVSTFLSVGGFAPSGKFFATKRSNIRVDWTRIVVKLIHIQATTKQA